MTRRDAVQLPVNDLTSLPVACAFVNDHRWTPDGVICPCCHGYVKVKEYTVTARQAYELRQLFRAGVPLHWRDWLSSSARMQCTLRYAGLIYQPTEDPEKPYNRSGFWAVTPRGARWLLDRSTIPKYTYVLFDQILGYSESQMTFAEALRNFAVPEDASGADLREEGHRIEST